MAPRSSSSLFTLFAALVVLFSGIVHAHNQLLAPWGTSCFFEDVKKGDQLAVTFQVGNRDPSATDQLAVDFWIADPSGNKISPLSRVADGDVSIPVHTTGRYEYCFSNAFSGTGTKDVTFHVHGVIYMGADDIEPGTLEAEVKQLSENIQSIKNEQGYIVIRERIHRNTAESTNARVKWWSIFQIIVVAVNSVFQIYYLKRFFEVKSNV
ncbi:hypothetical protein DV495_001877 [Geotrichum candidum]|nr:hypothetical protein DV495_001877 [Geotrichum candidum]